MKINPNTDYFSCPILYFAKARWASERPKNGWRGYDGWYEGNHYRGATRQGGAQFKQLELHNFYEDDAAKLIVHLNTLDLFAEEAYGVCN